MVGPGGAYHKGITTIPLILHQHTQQVEKVAEAQRRIDRDGEGQRGGSCAVLRQVGALDGPINGGL